MAYILAIDQGTTSSRAMLVNEDGAPAGMAQREFAQHFPRPGWVEHDPQEIWQVTLDVMRQATASRGISAREIAGIGITNQRETTLLWDRHTGEPVARAIVWQDRRTADLCDHLRAQGAGDLIAARTGLVIDAYFSASKIRWLLDNTPGLRRRAAAGQVSFGTIDSWLLWKLTGGRRHVTDVTNASRTLLFDIHRLVWDDELLRLFDIPREILPEVLPSSQVYGQCEPGLIGADVPIGGIAGDQQAALFGQGCRAPGMAKNTYGTGSFLLMNTGEKAVASRHQLLTTIAWQLAGQKPQYALEGAVFVTGAAIQWLRDGLGIISSAAESEDLARSLAGNDGVYFVPALAGLGAPYWDPHARGTIVGITRGTTRAHFARAALEAIGYQSRDLLECMARDSGVDLRELRADGGACTNGFLMQFQADILGVSVVVPRIAETTAMGAACLAALAVGLWRESDIASRWQAQRRYEPSMDADEREQLYSQWKRAVAQARATLIQ